jgi:oligopeptide/dipeptide ABC transporter ATP-binding protein
MANNNLLLEVNDLKTYFFTDSGTIRAVDGVSFAIGRAQTLGVLGESGCGKSVTGFSILRLVRPPGKSFGGEILYHRSGAAPVNLLDYEPDSRAIQQIRGKEIAMIFQEPMTSLDPLFSIGDQIVEAIVYHQDLNKRAAWNMAVEMLERVRMPEPAAVARKYPHQLSGGMRQRVMIAIALSCRPNLLIADEPTTALDVTTEAQILELMRDLQNDLHMAIMFITHDLGVIAEMAEEVIVMYLGKVVEQTSVRRLFSSPKHPYTQALLQSIPKIGQKSGQHLQTIEGMVPSPHDIPPGCKFHPRCPKFMPGVCDTAEPPLIQIEPGHAARCFLYGEGQS